MTRTPTGLLSLVFAEYFGGQIRPNNRSSTTGERQMIALAILTVSCLSRAQIRKIRRAFFDIFWQSAAIATRPPGFGASLRA
jgi:hypothetical protein